MALFSVRYLYILGKEVLEIIEVGSEYVLKIYNRQDKNL